MQLRSGRGKSIRYGVVNRRRVAYILYTADFFFINDSEPTEIHTLSLHDALPICRRAVPPPHSAIARRHDAPVHGALPTRSEEHTSELQSQSNLVCRLLLEKKNNAPNRPRLLAHLESFPAAQLKSRARKPIPASVS